MTVSHLTKEAVCVASRATIREAVEAMDTNCLGVVFITDGDRLVGVLSDGDFRRAVLRGQGDLAGPVSAIMNPHPSTLAVGAGAEETFMALSTGLARGRKVFPRIDEQGRVQDFTYRALGTASSGRA